MNIFDCIMLQLTKVSILVDVLVLASDDLAAKYIAVSSLPQQIDYLISQYGTVKQHVLYDLESKYATDPL